MFSPRNRIGKVCAGAVLAGVLLVGAALPASAQGPAHRDGRRDGPQSSVTLKVVRPGISILLKKGQNHPAYTRPDTRRDECRDDRRDDTQRCGKGWQKRQGHQRDGWRGKHDRRDDHRGDGRHEKQHRRGDDCCKP